MSNHVSNYIDKSFGFWSYKKRYICQQGSANIGQCSCKQKIIDDKHINFCKEIWKSKAFVGLNATSLLVATTKLLAISQMLLKLNLLCFGGFATWQFVNGSFCWMRCILYNRLVNVLSQDLQLGGYVYVPLRKRHRCLPVSSFLVCPLVRVSAAKRPS